MLRRMSLDLPRLLDRFDTAIGTLRELHAANGPGFAIALTVDGEALRRAHHGMAHLEWLQPVAGDTRFYLASESKPWVAALVMQAVAAGRVTLDQDMRALLPALAGCSQPVRLGHLLRHTGGIDDYLYLWRMQLGHDEHDLVTQAQALALIRRAGDVDFDPGSRHEYSNSHYVLLADWLERDAGLPLDEIARRRFFEPWGLHDTSFENDPRRVLPRRARSYRRDPARGWQDLPVHLASWGDGGMWSTLDDLVRAEAHWLDDWRRHGEPSLLARSGADDGGPFWPAALMYRFCVEVVPRAGRSLMFHGGAFAGFSSLVLRAPDAGWALIVLANGEGFDASASGWMERLSGDGG
jgi:CubicO group peptidase (beta-lactamase class C family)